MNELLASKIAKIVALLESVDERHWVLWLREDLADLRAGDSRAVQHFLSAYGAMGSFTDLYICRENGHRVKNDEIDFVNQKLSAMREDAWLFARAIAGRSEP